MKAWAGDRLAPNRVGRTQLVNSAGNKIPGSVLPANKRRCFNTHSSMSKFETETRRLDVLQLGQLNGGRPLPLCSQSLNLVAGNAATSIKRGRRLCEAIASD